MAYLIIFWGSLKAALGLTNPRPIVLGLASWVGKTKGEKVMTHWHAVLISSLGLVTALFATVAMGSRRRSGTQLAH